MAITLPKQKISAITQDPKNLIIFSKPKMGKSTALATLPGCLCVDLEGGGYDYIDACKVSVKSMADIKELMAALTAEIKETGKYPYKFIALDTLTVLEELVKPMALANYKATPAGSKFTGNNVLDAPMGAGYAQVRDCIEKVIEAFSKLAPNLILVCHTKDAAVAESDLTVKSIDLAGKTGRILSAKSDAIGFLGRDEDSNTILSFDTADKFLECGARPAHLRNKDIVLGEMQEDGNIEFHWERIYPSLAETK